MIQGNRALLIAVLSAGMAMQARDAVVLRNDTSATIRARLITKLQEKQVRSAGFGRAQRGDEINTQSPINIQPSESHHLSVRDNAIPVYVLIEATDSLQAGADITESPLIEKAHFGDIDPQRVPPYVMGPLQDARGRQRALIQFNTKTIQKKRNQWPITIQVDRGGAVSIAN